MEVIIESFEVEKLLMGARFGNAALGDHTDKVGVTDCT